MRNDLKGNKNIICTLVKYGDTFYGRHTPLNPLSMLCVLWSDYTLFANYTILREPRYINVNSKSLTSIQCHVTESSKSSHILISCDFVKTQVCLTCSLGKFRRRTLIIYIYIFFFFYFFFFFFANCPLKFPSGATKCKYVLTHSIYEDKNLGANWIKMC